MQTQTKRNIDIDSVINADTKAKGGVDTGKDINMDRNTKNTETDTDAETVTDIDTETDTDTDIATAGHKNRDSLYLIDLR